MPLAPVGGQPLSVPFPPVVRTGDANNVLLVANQTTLAGATGARTYTLPPLASVGAGAWCRVITVGVGGSLAISPNGAELLNDGVGVQTVTALRDVGILFIAKVLEGATAASWAGSMPAGQCSRRLMRE